MYKKIKEELAKRNYSFFEDYNLIDDTREIVVETEDEKMILIYKFDKFGKFLMSNYTYGTFSGLLKTMLACNIHTGQFLEIRNHFGNEKAKIRF